MKTIIAIALTHLILSTNASATRYAWKIDTPTLYANLYKLDGTYVDGNIQGTGAQAEAVYDDIANDLTLIIPFDLTLNYSSLVPFPESRAFLFGDASLSLRLTPSLVEFDSERGELALVARDDATLNFSDGTVYPLNLRVFRQPLPYYLTFRIAGGQMVFFPERLTEGDTIEDMTVEGAASYNGIITHHPEPATWLLLSLAGIFRARMRRRV